MDGIKQHGESDFQVTASTNNENSPKQFREFLNTVSLQWVFMKLRSLGVVGDLTLLQISWLLLYSKNMPAYRKCSQPPHLCTIASIRIERL